MLCSLIFVAVVIYVVYICIYMFIFTIVLILNESFLIRRTTLNAQDIIAQCSISKSVIIVFHFLYKKLIILVENVIDVYSMIS